MTIESEIYSKHMNLKLASAELGIPLQTLYWRLKKQGYPVAGDKSKYGNKKDKLAAKAEKLFSEIVPFAENLNLTKYQAEVDFQIGKILVDVKSSTLKPHSFRSKYKRWAFYFKRQTYSSDFNVCFCFSDDIEVEHILLIPVEIYSGIQTVSVSQFNSKWFDYKVSEKELLNFFSEVKETQL